MYSCMCIDKYLYIHINICIHTYVHIHRNSLGISDWTDSVLIAFLKTAIRGFLRGDMYTAMTEFVSRAEGSFGLQVHCSLEPGVVVIASKGQPMSLAYKNDIPLCLYGSEAEALAVPIDADGKWLSKRLDLDSHGEIIRVGKPKELLEGSYTNPNAFTLSSKSTSGDLYSYTFACYECPSN
jgi:glucosamine 6-phosphate synthetase-like amidotransferase/phosphosugar isomerase protein